MSVYEDNLKEAIRRATAAGDKAAVGRLTRALERNQSGGIGRQLGLGTRAVTHGLLAVPSMLGDAANVGINMLGGALGVSPNLRPVSGMFDEAMTIAGLPSPETDTERLHSSIQTGAAAAMGPGGVSRMFTKPGMSAPATGARPGMGFQVPLNQRASGAIQGATGPLTTGAAVARGLEAAPFTQALSGAAGGYGAEMAAQSGMSPLGQLGVGTAAGMAAPLAPLAARAVARTPSVLGELGRPSYDTGRQATVGRTLYDIASDPDAVLEKIAAGEGDAILGAEATLAQLTQDPGISIASKTILESGLNREKAVTRSLRANKSRVEIVDRIAQADKDLDELYAIRDDVTTPMRDAARESQVRPMNIKPIERVINTMLAGPSGKRQSLVPVLKHIRDNLYNKDGNPETSFDNLYGIRKDIIDIYDGKSDQFAAGRYLKKELMEIRNAVDAEIESKAPGYRAYMDEFSARSKEIDGITKVRELLTKASLATPGPDDVPQLSQAKWRTWYKNRRDEYRKILPDEHVELLDQVTRSLDRSVTPDLLASVKGSPTYANLTVANVIGSMFRNDAVIGHPALRGIVKPLEWLYAAPDRVMLEMLGEAMLDPQVARLYMQKATKASIQNVSKDMKARLSAMGYGAIAGTAAGRNDSTKGRTQY